MKAIEIESGDVLVQDGAVVYTVKWVEYANESGEFNVGVTFADGGSGVRVFKEDQEVPLTKG